MVRFPVNVRGLNVVLVVFSLLVLGGSAYVMSNNLTTSFGSRASKTIDTATGKLAKRGDAAFTTCKIVDASIDYAIIGSQPLACTPLFVLSSLADPFIGKRVIATGVFENGIFYATDLKLVESPTPVVSEKPRPSLPSQVNPNAY